jgi:hypothetical protein
LIRDIVKAEEQWAKFPLETASVEEIRAQIKKNGENFIDIHFPPQDSSVFNASLGQAFDRVIHWRRPRDFMLGDSRADKITP